MRSAARSFAIVLVLAGVARATNPGPVPLISQNRPAGSSSRWRGDRRCLPTSMAMVARAYGKHAELSDAALIQKLDLIDGKLNEGTTGRGLRDMAAALGLGARRHAGFDDATIATYGARRRPMIVLGRSDPGNRAAHAIVVSERDERGQYVVNDPGGPAGKRYTFSETQLRQFVASHPTGAGGVYVFE